jgi:hypothetical protein
MATEAGPPTYMEGITQCRRSVASGRIYSCAPCTSQSSTSVYWKLWSTGVKIPVETEIFCSPSYPKSCWTASILCGQNRAKFHVRQVTRKWSRQATLQKVRMHGLVRHFSMNRNDELPTTRWIKLAALVRSMCENVSWWWSNPSQIFIRDDYV